MRNTGLEETQAGIKTARRNINHLRYADDTTLMEESEELKSLLMKVKVESAKVGLKVNIQKIKIMASGPITSWEIDGQKVETVLTLIFWAPKSATDFLRMDWLDLLPRSKRLLIYWLQSPSAVILEPPKIKSVTVFIVSASICHEVMGPDAMTFVF